MQQQNGSVYWEAFSDTMHKMTFYICFITEFLLQSSSTEQQKNWLKPSLRQTLYAWQGSVRMGNSALKAHLETAQKTGVFQLTGKGLTEVMQL